MPPPGQARRRRPARRLRVRFRRPHRAPGGAAPQGCLRPRVNWHKLLPVPAFGRSDTRPQELARLVAMYKVACPVVLNYNGRSCDEAHLLEAWRNDNADEKCGCGDRGCSAGSPSFAPNWTYLCCDAAQALDATLTQQRWTSSNAAARMPRGSRAAEHRRRATGRTTTRRSIRGRRTASCWPMATAGS